MPATLSEKAKGRVEVIAGKDSYVEIVYLIEGAADESAARTVALADAATSYEGLGRTSVELIERIDGAEPMWNVRVRYTGADGSVVAPLPSDKQSFSLGGATQHITQSLETIQNYTAGGAGTAPDLEGAIGFDGERVNGCDILVPTFDFSRTAYFDDADIDAAYLATLAAIAAAPINDDTFFGFSAGEVLFRGCTGQPRSNASQDGWEITFNFSQSPNKTGLQVGDITGISKGGWHYMWPRYEDDVDTNAIVRVPISVYVERVYDESDFEDLGIGTTW